MKPTIAFYHPKEIASGSNRASEIRVAQMVNAFEKLGYRVWSLTGKPAQRHTALREFVAAVESGLKVEFVYGECTNAPIALAEKAKLPANFLADYRFFAWLKKGGIPSGLFYRDVYWRFELFKDQLPGPLSTLLKPLYYLDWYIYDRYWDKLFLPSDAMNRHLPKPRHSDRFQALPPGCDPDNSPRPEFSSGTRSTLKLLYVGGIEPTVYDISTLLDTIAKRDDISLTLCCRVEEWNSYREFYQPKLSPAVELVHASGTELARHYHDADMFLMVMPKTDYMDFAVPVKFFESVSYALPMISMNQQEIAQRIEKHKLGWVISSIDELGGLLNRIKQSDSALSDCHQQLLEYRQQCSWQSRAIAARQFITDGGSNER